MDFSIDIKIFLETTHNKQIEMVGSCLLFSDTFRRVVVQLVRLIVFGVPLNPREKNYSIMSPRVIFDNARRYYIIQSIFMGEISSITLTVCVA